MKPLFDVGPKLYTGTQRFPSVVISTALGIMSVLLFVKIAWPYPQLHKFALACAAGFLILIAVSMRRVRNALSAQADAGSINAIVQQHQWANAGFFLLSMIMLIASGMLA